MQVIENAYLSSPVVQGAVVKFQVPERERRECGERGESARTREQRESAYARASEGGREGGRKIERERERGERKRKARLERSGPHIPHNP